LKAFKHPVKSYFYSNQYKKDNKNAKLGFKQNGKMNIKLMDQIISLILSLNKEERKSFLKSNRDTNYMELFKIIHACVDEKDAKEKIERESKLLKGSLVDMRENLLKKLIEFIHRLDQQKHLEHYEIKNNIESVAALYERKQYELAHEIIGKTYKKLKKLKVNATNYHLFLQYLNQCFMINHQRPDIITRSLPNNFDDDDAIRWLNYMAKNAADHIVLADKNISNKFNDNLFINLLTEYAYAKEQFRDAEELLMHFNPFSFLSRHSKDEDTIQSFGITQGLFALKLGLKLNDSHKIEHLLHRLESNASFFEDKNYQVYLFLMLEIFDFRLNIGLDTGHFSIFQNIKMIPEIKKKDLIVFTEKEIEGTSLRIEVNKGIVFLLTENYEKAYGQFTSIPLLEKIPVELKYYIKLFEMLSYLWDNNQFKLIIYEKGLQFLENSKYKGTKFSRAFLKLLINNTDRSNLVKQSEKFLNTYSSNTSFEKVSKHWLQIRIKHK
jgi:hypothetical protein